MKRKKWFLAGGGLAVIAIAVIAIFCVHKEENEDIVFFVKHEPVYSQEAGFVVAKERLTVRNQLMNEYNIEEGAFSWDETYGEMTALEHLKETVIQECTKNKMIQIIAKENGVADKIDYPDIKEMNQEDTRIRNQRTRDGEVIYGNTAYQEADYYDYVLSNLEQQSYYRLVEDGVLQVTDEEVQKIYEENKEMMEEAGAEENTAKTIGLQQKYAGYIRERAEKAEVDNINEEVLAKVLESAR